MCLGSSCFSNGNQVLLEQVKTFLKDHNLDDTVQLKGSLCQGRCKDGPSIVIDTESYIHVSPKSLNTILIKHLLKSGAPVE